MSRLIKRSKREIHWWLILLPVFVGTLCACAEGPQWWFDREVINSSSSDDYAAANFGQLKWIASNAYDECMEHGMPENSEHDALKIVLEAWFADDVNCSVLNVGQLKHIGSLFHAWLASSGYTNAMLFFSSGNEYVAANIGQVKNVFSFNPSGEEPSDPDYDQDGLLDVWEQMIVNADINDLINCVEDVRSQDDFDGDGVSNGDEYTSGTDPLSVDSKPPVVGFASGATVVSEVDGQAMAILNIDPVPGVDVSFNVRVGGGTAVGGVDYEFMTADVTLSPSVQLSSLQLTILTDEVREPVETVKLIITDLSAGAVLGTSEHIVQIYDDMTDSEPDGLPDWWEIKYWGNLHQDGAGNDDGDGWSNLKEYKLGTDPTKGWVADTNNILNLQVQTPLGNL